MAQEEYSAGNRMGIEVARTAIHAAVIRADGGILLTRSLEIESPESASGRVEEVAKSLLADFGQVEGIGLAVPGLVDRTSGRVAFSANIPLNAELDMAGDLRNAIGLNPTLENDANAAAYAEYRVGAGRGSENMFYATLGDGVGGAFIFAGEIWRGASGFAGEFGYVPINSEGSRLEEVASAANIIRRTRSRFHQDSTSSLNKLTEEDIDLPAIIRAAGNDDDFAQLMLKRTGTYVGTGIASVINLLNIERVVVGGEIMQAKQLVLDAIVERARELSFEPSFKSTSIVEGELGTYAAAIGAALLSSSDGPNNKS